TALMYAASSGHVQAVKLLLSKGAEVNAGDVDGRTALIGSARGGHKEVMLMLLQKGANVNSVFHGATFASKVVGRRTDSRTALNAALEHGYDEIAELLRAYGAVEYAEK
ncbi:MAG: ankyrin repeat domain-containing protein, partial [Pseudomonadota bacterium]